MFKDGHSVRQDAGSRLRARVAGLLVAIAAAAAALAPSAYAQVGDGYYGVNAGDLFKLPQSRWDGQLGAMSQDGIQVLRLGAWWSDLEPGPPKDGVHSYAWQDTDQWVAAMARHGVRWEPLLSFSATWDSAIPGDYTAYPASASDFAAFGAALAKRYGPGGDFWAAHPELQALPVQAYEVWNEENATRFWHPGDGAPAKYAALYAATRGAIHAVDPNARVVVGGLAAPASDVMPAADFIQQMVASRPDLRGNVDAVAFHPYSPTDAGVYSQVAAFRQSLDATFGAGVPIEITEVGWSSANKSVADIGAGLADLATSLPRSGCGVDRVEPYAWVGPELDPSDPEQWFGINNRDGSAKASAAAYASAIQQMRSPSAPTSSVGICGSTSPAPQAAKQAAKRGPTLRLKVKRDRRHRARLRAWARCPAGCRIEISVMPARSSVSTAGAAPILAHRTLRFSRRLHRLELRIPPRRARQAGKRVRVEVVAVGRAGQRTVRSRSVRIR